MDRKIIRILVSTESADDARSIEHELRSGGLSCVVRRVSSPDMFASAVTEHRADILLADLGNKQFPPADAIRLVRDECLAIPVIVVSDAHDEPAAAELVKSGAALYILWSHLAHLPGAIRTTMLESPTIVRDEGLLLKDMEIEQSYHNVFNSITDAIYILDANGVFLDVNEGAVRMYGFYREEFIGQTPELLSAPGMNDLTSLPLLFENALAGIPQHFEWWARRKNGSVFPKDITLTEGIFKGSHVIIATASDITERKRNEEMLRQSEELYRAVMSQIVDGIVLFDPVSKRIFQTNNAFLSMLGYDSDEIWRLTIYDIMDPLIDRARHSFYSDPADKNYAVSETRYIKKDGTKIDVETTGSRIHYGNHDMICLLVRDISERKRTEDQFRKEKEQQQIILNTARICMWFKDVNNNIIRVNKAAAEFMGMRADEIEGRNAADIFPREQAEKYLIEDLNVINSGVPKLGIIETATTRDGETRWVRTDRILWKDAAGAVAGVVAFSTDITEHRYLEEQVSILSRAVEQSSFMTIVTDIDGVIQYVNKKFTEVVGFTRDEVIGTKNVTVISGLADEAERLAIWATISAGNEWRGNFINRTKRGIQFFEYAIITPIRTGDGTLSHYLIVKEDVTERTVAAEKIKEQAMLLDASSDAVLVEDLTGGIRYWNKGAEVLYGFSMAEAMQNGFLQRISYEESTTPERVVKQLFERGQWRGEVKQTNKAGKVIYVDSRRTLMRDSEGMPKSVLTVNTDITEKKLLQSQFLRAQRLESLGTLAGGIAHDLNNVLAPILMSVQMMRSQLSTERKDRALTTIEVSATRGKEILQQVLTFARGVDGDATIFQPRLLIRELDHLMKETFPRSIQIKTDAPNDLWMMSGSITRIHQVLMNLCVNARDAMPNGGSLSVTLDNLMMSEESSRMHVGSKPGAYIVITVADTGNGIPQELIERIFDPFFTTKEQGRGTGLGLSTVHSIVKGYGGFVTVYSELSIGTTIKVYLPAITGGVETPEQDVKREIRMGSGECILLIDDEHSIVTVTREILEMSGYSVITAFNGKEGLAVYENNKHRIALVLTDIMMPLMDGYTMMTALRAIEPTVKIIAASGLPISTNAVQPAIDAANAFLNKPYSVDKLLTMIYDVVHNDFENQPD
jgi:PAS domain S-box-containing protein